MEAQHGLLLGQPLHPGEKPGLPLGQQDGVPLHLAKGGEAPGQDAVEEEVLGLLEVQGILVGVPGGLAADIGLAEGKGGVAAPVPVGGLGAVRGEEGKALAEKLLRPGQVLRGGEAAVDAAGAEVPGGVLRPLPGHRVEEAKGLGPLLGVIQVEVGPGQ